MTKRIIPISSGKGGVGKTSFAVNLALCMARFGKTVLVDLDTGTSSIRNVIGAPIKKDLYHFLRKGEPLQGCITPLPDMLDAGGHFKNFGFVAAPVHMIAAITNMNQATRNQIIDGINSLDADYVILDLKAGLDAAVIDFLPQSNSGILVFTPNHPAATLAASDIAKAILFRKFREVFHPKSPLYERLGNRRVNPAAINTLLDRVEDVYDDTFANIDNFLQFMSHKLGPDHPVVRILTNMVGYFHVYYILNRFDGVENSYQTAVKPFVENIASHVSQRVSISNLGWIIDSDKYHKANVASIPYILQAANDLSQPTPGKRNVDAELEALYNLCGISPDKGRKLDGNKKATDQLLNGQLRAMQNLFKTRESETLIQNFDYVVSCIRYMFKHRRITAFGDARIIKRGELVHLLLGEK